MKKLLVSIILLSAAAAGFAQTETTSFNVDGIKVILKPTVKEIINVRLVFRGGVANYSATQAGIENFTLNATTQCGTAKYSANAFKEVGDAYGIDIGAGEDYDYGNIDMDCIYKYFDRAWDLFAEAVANPVFDANEVELLRNKILAGVQQEKTNPDRQATQLAMQNAFAGTPYATYPGGTEETLGKFTAGDLKAYYKTILNKNQFFIVVAGRITKEELVAKIHASFAALPSRPYEQVSYKEPVWDDYTVLAESRQLSTNYISAIMNAPPVNGPDNVPYQLGVAVIGGSLFNDLRTKMHLSYDPGSASEMRQMPYGLMYVSTNDPKAAVQEMLIILRNIRAYGVNPKILKHLKRSYITGNYIRQQSTAAITGRLGIAEVLGGWDMEARLPDLINQVTVEQINNALNKYILGVRWGYLGDIDKEKEAAEAFRNNL